MDEPRPCLYHLRQGNGAGWTLSAIGQQINFNAVPGKAGVWHWEIIYTLELCQYMRPMRFLMRGSLAEFLMLWRKYDLHNSTSRYLEGEHAMDPLSALLAVAAFDEVVTEALEVAKRCAKVSDRIGQDDPDEPAGWGALKSFNERVATV